MLQDLYDLMRELSWTRRAAQFHAEMDHMFGDGIPTLEINITWKEDGEEVGRQFLFTRDGAGKFSFKDLLKDA